MAIVGAMVLVAGVTQVRSAFAASLGTSASRNLGGFTMAAVPAAPTVIAWENFDGANGTAISGTVTDGGARTWSQFGGTWTISEKTAVSTSGQNAGLILNAGVDSASAEATVFPPASGYWNAEIIVNADATGADQIEVDYEAGSPGTLTLYKRQSGTFTLLATATGVPLPAAPRLRVESLTNSQIRVLLDDVLYINYRLTNNERTRFKNASHQFFGIGTWNDAASRFEDFHVDA